jgi:multisubunit Na+/H+ antiporter MnhC subunit
MIWLNSLLITFLVSIGLFIAFPSVYTKVCLMISGIGYGLLSSYVIIKSLKRVGKIVKQLKEIYKNEFKP